MEEEEVGNQMTDFVSKREEYKDLSTLRSKMRKLPVKVLNRRYKKMEE